MSIENNLLPDEIIIQENRQHWVIFLPTIFWFFATWLAYIYVPQFNFIAVFAVVMTLLTFINVLIGFASSVYVVTNKRILMRSGFINRRSLDLLLNKVESIQTYQPLLGRIFGYGSVMVVGTGGSQDRFDNIANPELLQRNLQEQLTKL